MSFNFLRGYQGKRTLLLGKRIWEGYFCVLWCAPYILRSLVVYTPFSNKKLEIFVVKFAGFVAPISKLHIIQQKSCYSDLDHDQEKNFALIVTDL